MEYRYLSSVPTSYGMVSHHRLREGFTSGATFYDQTGNGYTATATNSPVPQFPGVDFVSASSMYLDIGACYNGVKTFLAWLKVDSIGVSESLMDLNGVDYFGHINATIAQSGFAGGAQVLYVNGVAAATTITTNWCHVGFTDTVGRNASDYDIGRKDIGYCNAVFADVRLYNRVLSAEDVKSVYYQTRGIFGV